MKRIAGLLPLLVLLFLATACGRAFYSQVYRESRFPADVSSKTFYFAPSEKQKSSPEYEGYAKSLSSRLVKAGFARAESGDKADYLVAIDYRVEENWDFTGQSLLFDRGDSNFAGDLTGLDIVSGAPRDHSMYDRFFRIRFLDNKTPGSGGEASVYEAEVTSTGTNSSFAAVSECVFVALFKDFFTKGVQRVSIDSSECLK